jgi:hypothetical protein
MLKDRPLDLLRGANPASAETAGEFATAINLHERVLSSIDRPDAQSTDSATSRSSALAKGRALSRQLTGRRRLALAVALLLAALLAVPLVGARIVDLFWTNGTPVPQSALVPQDQWLLDQVAGAGPRINKIASDGVVSFYLVRGRDGQMCIASGRVGGRPTIGSIGCSSVSELRRALPSPEHPLYAETSVAIDRTGTATITKVIGLADTGLARVELRSADGALLGSATVNDHVFKFEDVSVAPPVTIRAIAKDGRALYEKKLG